MTLKYFIVFILHLFHIRKTFSFKIFFILFGGTKTVAGNKIGTVGKRGRVIFRQKLSHTRGSERRCFAMTKQSLFTLPLVSPCFTVSRQMLQNCKVKYLVNRRNKYCVYNFSRIDEANRNRVHIGLHLRYFLLSDIQCFHGLRCCFVS